MKTIPDHFDDLHTSEASYEEPVIHGRTIRIPVKDLAPMATHPLAGMRVTDKMGFIEGVLIFKEVFSSRREISEHIGNPKKAEGFKEMYTVEDMGVDSSEGHSYHLYEFEGCMESPSACVNWEIKAKYFERPCLKHKPGSFRALVQKLTDYFRVG